MGIVIPLNPEARREADALETNRREAVRNVFQTVADLFAAWKDGQANVAAVEPTPDFAGCVVRFNDCEGCEGSIVELTVRFVEDGEP